MAKPANKAVEKPMEESAALPLRVLFVEDSENDMLLELDELQEAGYTVDAIRVQNAGALRDALQQPWDLVLSDYNMPSFTGMDALQIIQEHDLDIPFILVSGVIGEEAAVNLMKAGAHDYIIKDKMARLIPAVQRELREACVRQDHRESQNALQQSELRLRTLLDTAADAIIVINQQGMIESINPATEKMLGYDEQELTGQNIKILMPEPYHGHHDAYLQRYAEGGISRIIDNGREVKARRKDGSVFPADLSVTKMEIQGETLYTGIIRDITERKLAESALQKERNFATQILHTAPVIVLILDRAGMIQYVNPYFEQLTGCLFEDIRGKEWFASFLPENDSDRIRSLFQHAWGEARTRGNINPIVTSSGVELEIEWHDNIIYDSHGEAEALLAIGQDVTERKRSEESLRQSEQRLQLALNASGQAPWDLDLITRNSTVNEAHANMLGYRLEEFDTSENAFAERLHPDDRDTVFSAFNACICGDTPGYKTEFRMQTKTGAWKWIHTVGEIVSRDEKGQPLRMVGTHTDIDERKQAEEALRISTLQLADAQAIGHMGNWNWDIQNGSLNWSDEIYRIFGLQAQIFEPTLETFMQRVHRDDREMVQTAIDKALHEMQPYSIDHRIRLEDGSVRFVQEQGEVRFDDHGEPKAMIGTVQDITERKLTEQVLRKSENRFRATFEQAAVGVAHVGLDGRWLQVNDRLCQIVSYKRNELLRKNFQDITHPDDLTTDLDYTDELLAGKRPHYSLEKRYLRKDGSTTWIQLTVSLVRNENNKPDYFIKVVEDINDRKAAEARILAALAEKDTVLRELHHRVKNNMQVISSLLSLQARYAAIKDPQQALQESRQRIRAMALIHERLYSTSDLALVDFKDYLRYLGERLARLFHETGVALKIQINGETIQLPVDQALPCALICNELITNAIRHAYPPEQRERLIEIRIADVATRHPGIMVRDYGQGMDSDKLNDEPTTLGLVIVQALTRQLGGQIHFESSKGTIASLTFPFNNTIQDETLQ